MRDVYREYPVILLWYPEAIGYTHACNVGMEAAKGEYFVLLNDDVVVLGSEWITLLLQPFLDDPKMAITGPLELSAPEADRPFLVFFCVMISRAVTEAIGTLDEVFNPGYGEDCDFAMRAVDAGWKIQQVPPTKAELVNKGCEDLPKWKRDKMWSNPFPLYHDGNQTFGSDPTFEGLIERNSKILKERYGQVKVNIERAKHIDGWFAWDEMEWLARQVKALPKGMSIKPPVASNDMARKPFR